MPVLVIPKVCLDREHCYAAGACPFGAYHHNREAKSWEVDATICGDCPGPCINFCDADAVRWGDNLFEIDLLRQQIAGTLTPAEMAEARAARHEEEARAREEEARKAVVSVVEITQANFQQEVIDADLPVLMDCWAAWCGPCKQFGPTFEAYAARHAGTVKCVKLNTDQEAAIARSLGITALPTLIMFYKGQLVDGAQGALSAQQLDTWATSRLDALRKMYGDLPTSAAATAPATEPGAGLVLGGASATPPPKAAPKKTADKARAKLYLP